MARVIHFDITLAQASSWQWWTALTTFDYKDGLIYLDTGNKDDLFNRDLMKTDGEIRESKLLWTFGNFSRFIRPEMQRLSVDVTTNEDNNDLLVSAYHDKTQGEVAIVLINQSDKKRKLDINHTNVHYDKKYVTSKKDNLRYYPVKGEVLKIPGRSVTTLLGKVKKDLSAKYSAGEMGLSDERSYNSKFGLPDCYREGNRPGLVGQQSILPDNGPN